MKVQWIVLIAVGAVALVGAAGFIVFGRKSLDLSPYLGLKEPRIAAMADERVLEVPFYGPADTVISKAYAELFKAYYSTKGAPKGPGMRPPKARYSNFGEVAEILHPGPYETESPTIDRLLKFIESSGYRIVGDHEEEYLKGPGYGKIDPKDYATIIRYRVERK